MKTERTKTPDPQLRQQLDAKIQKYNEAFDKNDAGAVAAFFTEDAVFVTDKGPIYGREAIEKHFADLFQNVHFSNNVTTYDPNSPHDVFKSEAGAWLQWNCFGERVSWN